MRVGLYNILYTDGGVLIPATDIRRKEMDRFVHMYYYIGTTHNNRFDHYCTYTYNTRIYIINCVQARHTAHRTSIKYYTAVQ